MKNKRFFLIFCLILFSMLVSAQQNNTEEKKIANAYDCLKKQISEQSSLSLQEAIFSILALGTEQKAMTTINNEKKSDANLECWPKSGCKIKETAQVLFAYARIKKDGKALKDWLISKSITPKDLEWYLEIDIQNHESSTCTLSYDGKTTEIQITEDMKIEGNPGGCFSLANENYWLKFEEKCIGKEIAISCNKEFIAALVYKKRGGTTIYVTSYVQSGSATSSISLSVNSKCLATSSSCDYEGTLWAALALNEINEDISPYLPFLLAFSEDNQKYLPSAFLYILGQNDQYDELVAAQKSGKYWNPVASPYTLHYNTALALLALSSTDSMEASAAKNYLLSSQTAQGCWNNNNIRDTAFILFAAWPKTFGTGTGEVSCEEARYYCELREHCLAAGGTVFDNYFCPGIKKCCSKKALISCAEKNGIVCAQNQECKGGVEEPSTDGTCCVGGACVNKEPENTCEEIFKGSCETKCIEGEEEAKDAKCPDTKKVCCVKSSKPTPSPTGGGGGSTLLIILLGILIILVLIAILNRKKIQMWIYSRKAGKGGTQPPLSRGPPPRGMPPGTAIRARPMPPPLYPRQPAVRPAQQPSQSAEEKEFDETMKKLREMGK